MTHDKAGPKNVDALEYFTTKVKPLVRGGRIIDAIGHWSADGTFITPAFVVETMDGKIVKLIISTDDKLSAPAWVLVEDLGSTSH